MFLILDVLRQSLSTRCATRRTPEPGGGNTSDPCLWGVLVIHIGSSDGVLLRFYFLSPPKNLHLLHRNSVSSDGIHPEKSARGTGL